MGVEELEDQREARREMTSRRTGSREWGRRGRDAWEVCPQRWGRGSLERRNILEMQTGGAEKEAGFGEGAPKYN